MYAYLFATQCDPQWYKAWHTWALANFEVVGHIESQADTRLSDIPGEILAGHVMQAIRGMQLSLASYGSEG